MSSLKLMAACAVGALALSSTAAHALVLPSTATSPAVVEISIEIEGGTIASSSAPTFTGSETTSGPGPNSTILTDIFSQVSSIDEGCVTPTFGCAVSYSVFAFASATDGDADADGMFGFNRFEVVVEDSAFLTVTLDTLSLTETVVSGTGIFGGATTLLFFGGAGFINADTSVTSLLPSSFGDLVEGQSGSVEILNPGTYELFLGQVRARANVAQSLPITVDAPQSLALLGFGLIALGGFRKRRA